MSRVVKPLAPRGGVIFDLDGTLVDTLPDLLRAMNLALGDMGQPALTPRRLRPFIGGGVARLAAAIYPGDSRSQQELRSRFLDHYGACLVERSRPFPGIVDMVMALHASSIPLCVLSNKPHDQAKVIVEALFPARPFVEVLGARLGKPMKPSPEGALALAKVMGCKPESCVVVGDTEVDIRTAQAARMRSIAVTWGYRGLARLAREGAEHWVRDPASAGTIAMAMVKDGTDFGSPYSER